MLYAPEGYRAQCSNSKGNLSYSEFLTQAANYTVLGVNKPVLNWYLNIS